MINNINDLHLRVSNCAGCGTSVHTFICTNDGSGNYVSKKSALFNEKVDLNQYDSNNNAERKSNRIIYTSYCENKYLNFCWFYESPALSTTRELNPIFKLNIYNNEIIGDPESIQNLFWHKMIVLFHVCCNELCNNAYMAETEQLIFERKNKKFMPLRLNLEGYTHKANEYMYFFFNSTEQLFRSNTTLMRYGPDLTRGTVVTKLPLMDFSTIKTGIDKKIKTILTFL